MRPLILLLAYLELPAKITRFIDECRRLNNANPRVVVVGGGAAGTELAFTLHARLLKDLGKAPDVTLVDRTPHHSTSLIRQIQHAADIRAVNILRGHSAIAAECVPTNPFYVFIMTHVSRCFDGQQQVVLDDGRRLQFDVLVLVTGPAARSFQRDSTDLKCDGRGFIRVRNTLQCTDHDDVFACGDCSSMDTFKGEFPPKAGVYAVRAAPILVHNIQRRLTASGSIAKQINFISFFSC